MPLKCSVKDCKSNYDTTTEKVTVFAFPSDQELLEKWLER
jgi:THAP domain